MIRLAGAILYGSLASLPLTGTVPSAGQDAAPAPLAEVTPATQPAPTPPKPEPPKPPTVDQVLQRGTLVVVSKRSQRAYVFKDGALWGASAVSTGRRGHATPAGVFPILQKQVYHRSNLYSNAPMPYMQRLTWSGIAMHAGHLPGYPASHGCIRLPARFARTLYGLTKASSTVVVVANDRLGSHREALALAGGREVPPPLAPQPRLAGPAPQQPATGSVQTIQLAAAPSAAGAAALWQRLQSEQPRLAALDEVIVPAVVNGRQVYRLRASAPAAHVLCSALRRNGVACLKVL